MAEAQVTPPPNRANVLLIVLDDLGIESLGFYGYNPGVIGCPAPSPSGLTIPSHKTPNLASLASNGVTFRRAYSYPLCSSTNAMILTGRHAFRTGMGHQTAAMGNNWTVPSSERTIAEMLKEGTPPLMAKYRCGFFGKWALEPGTPCDPMQPGLSGMPANVIDQGFDHFFGSLLLNDVDHFSWPAAEARRSPAFQDCSLTYSHQYSATVVRQKAVEWIQSTVNPFFAQVSFNLPHPPYQVPPQSSVSPETWTQITNLGFDTEDQVPGSSPDAPLVYSWMVESVDHEIGALIAGLGNKLPFTTILVTADNGTPGNLLPSPYIGGEVQNGGHGKGSPYEQGTRVPLVASGYRVAGRGFHEGVVSLVDLWRTIAAIANVSPGQGGDDSWNLFDLLQDPLASIARTEVFVQVYEDNGIYNAFPTTGQPVASDCTIGLMVPDCFPSPTFQPLIPRSNVRAMVGTDFKYIRTSGFYLDGTRFVQEGIFRLTMGAADYDPCECSAISYPSLTDDCERERVCALRTRMLELCGFY